MVSDKRLLILGGNRYNRDCIRSARSAGFFTLVADRNPASPGFVEADAGLSVDILDVDGLARAIESHGGVDGIVSLAEVGVRVAAELSERLDLPTIGVEAAARATSKAAMREAWRPLGKRSVDFAVVASPESCLAAVRRLGAFPLIIKPDRSFGGSRGVSRIDSAAEVPAAFEFARAAGLPGTRVIVETCLTGTEHSCEVLIHEGQTSLLCIGRKIKSPPPYRVDTSVLYPSAFTREEESAIGRMCDDAIHALGLRTGVAHVEFVQTAKGPVLMELGARCGGGHTPQLARHVSGVDEFVEVCRLACGLPPQRFFPLHRKGGEYRFIVFPPGEIHEVRIARDVRERAGVHDVDVTIPLPARIEGLRTTSDRAGFAVVFGEDAAAAQGLGNWVCGHVEAVYADGSTRHALTSGELAALAPGLPPEGRPPNFAVDSGAEDV
jgi:biotin carboxylase